MMVNKIQHQGLRRTVYTYKNNSIYGQLVTLLEKEKKIKTLYNTNNIQMVCVGGSVLTESLLTDYYCMPSARTMECSRRSVYIVGPYFARKQFGVNRHICMNV